MTKPDSIVTFERFFLGSLLLGAANFAFSFQETAATMARMPEMNQAGFGSGFLIMSVILGMVINLIIWFFIARRGSKIAKWIFVIFFAFGCLSTIWNLNDPLSPKGYALGIVAILTGLQGFAVFQLFRPDALAWFDKRSVDPRTFD